MASKKLGRDAILATFFDDGTYTNLFADGPAAAAFGTANGQPVYAVCQDGAALSAKDVERMVRVLELAAKTGNPVVTFYDSIGAKLEEGLAALSASTTLSAAVAQLSGVVPQVAVVVGVCGASAALAAANADVCIMAEGAELFFTPPFTSAAKGDKLPEAGTAAFAAKAGVAALVAKDAAEAALMAAHVVGLLPANNLSSPSVFAFEAPAAAFPAKRDPAAALAALADKDSLLELYAGFGKKAVTALGTFNGNAVGFVATGEQLCRACVSKIARFVRLCDAFSIPLVTVVDTEGFVPSSADDQAGGIREAARLAATYGDATTAQVAVISGKAVGPVFAALGAADLVVALEGCTIAPVEPTVAVSVLYKDELEASDSIEAAVKKKAAQYAAESCSARAAVAAGVADFVASPASVRGAVLSALDMLATKRASRMPKKHGNMAL